MLSIVWHGLEYLVFISAHLNIYLKNNQKAQGDATTTNSPFILNLYHSPINDVLVLCLCECYSMFVIECGYQITITLCSVVMDFICNQVVPKPRNLSTNSTPCYISQCSSCTLDVYEASQLSTVHCKNLHCLEWFQWNITSEICYLLLCGLLYCSPLHTHTLGFVKTQDLLVRYFFDDLSRQPFWLQRISQLVSPMHE